MKFLNFFIVFIFLLLKTTIFGQTTHVCGQILDPTGQCPGYEGVPVVFTNDSGGVICETTTNSSGGYCCPIQNSEFPITICATPNCPWPFQNPGAAGITTADLIRIQTYILSLPDPLNPSGIWPSDFLYWADVNGDGKVTASDIVVLHQYLLGIIDVPMGNRCRVVPHWALNFEPSNNYYNNCNTVFEPSPIGFTLGGNFNLYNIGDVNFSGQPDCNLGDFTGGGAEAFVSPSSSFELTPVKNSDNSISFFYNGTASLAAILFSLDINALGGLKLSSDLKNIEITEKDGFLHFSFFSNHKEDLLHQKELFRIENLKSTEDIRFINSLIMDAHGSLYKIAQSFGVSVRKLKNTVSVNSESSILLTLDETMSQVKMMNLRIVNASGVPIEQVEEFVLNDGKSIIIDNLNLSNGVYFLTGVTDTGESITNKFIVIH